MQIVTYTTTDPLYSQAYALRNLVLRHPLGLDLKDEDLSRDQTDYHIGLLDGETLAASLILHPLDGGDIQMRQVCTYPSRQGEGLGRMLVTAAEEMARQMGYKRMVLHGRESAAGFYRKLGYLTDGVRFYELNIPHLSFHKTLV